MSDVIDESVPENSPAPATAESVPAASALSASVTIQCPACAAKLQKVTVTPGVKVHCLHCGARFLPANAGAAQPAAGGTIFADPAPPKMREPKSPGYWLLRVPATVAMTVGIFVTALIAWNELRLAYMNRLEFWVLGSYVPLIALVGTFAFFASRALARIDARMTKELWSRGLLRENLPQMPGSSLPYIAPFAIVGGFIPVFMFGFGEAGTEQVIGGALYGAVLFLLGFMAEDVRQFAWRQHCAAEVIAPPGWRDRNQPYGSSPYPWTALACAAGFGILAVLEFYIGRQEWRQNQNYYAYSTLRSDLILYICVGLMCVAAAITGFMLCCDIERAVVSWLRATKAIQAEPDTVPQTPLMPPHRGLLKLALRFPAAWMLYAAVWMFVSGLFNASSLWNDWRLGAWILLALTSAGLALWFSRLMRQFAAWSWAKRMVYRTIRKQSDSQSALFVGGWPEAVIRLTLLLVSAQTSLMAIQLVYEMTRWRIQWEGLFAIPIVLGIANYPMLFVITATREFVGLEQSLAEQQSPDDA